MSLSICGTKTWRQHTQNEYANTKSENYRLLLQFKRRGSQRSRNDFLVGTKTNRRVGRPTKRWEDDISQLVKLDEIEETKGKDLKNNGTWLKAARDQKI